MCNEYLRYKGYRSYVDEFSQTRPNLLEQPSSKAYESCPSTWCSSVELLGGLDRRIRLRLVAG
jgi:hypothetical protein